MCPFRQEMAVRENRLRGLTQQALQLLREGRSEDEVAAELRRIALRSWGLSATSIYNYAAVALERAKSQLAQQQQGERGAENAEPSG